MIENTQRRQGRMRQRWPRIKTSRFGRRARWWLTCRAVRKRARGATHPLSRPSVAAPRLWQRYLLVPVVTLVRGIGNGLAWVRTVLLPAAAPILAGDPAQCLIVGHRGACVAAIENTIEACEHAIELEGADAVEIDLCVTQDAHVVVWHDWDPDTLVAMARQAEAEREVLCRPVVPPVGHPLRRPVCDLTLAQLREHYGYAVIGQAQTIPARLPVLEEVVRWARTKPQLKAVFLDCKVPPARKELLTVVAATLRREVERAPVGARFVFLTPYAEVHEVMQAVVPAAGRAFDVEIPLGFVRDPTPVSAVAWARAAGNGWASIGRPLFTLGGWWTFRTTIRTDLALMREARRAPHPEPPHAYVCWTINRPHEMRYLLGLGVSGILTDFPVLLRGLQALTLADELGMRPLQAHCHRGLGTLSAAMGQREPARTALATAITMYHDMDMTFWLPDTEAALAQVEGRSS